MIRDQATLVRPDGSVMFDRPNEAARQGVESSDGWHNRTVRKAMHGQSLRGVALTLADRIAPEERPDPKVRNAARMGRDGKITVDFRAARSLLWHRYSAESRFHMKRLEDMAEQATWFEPIADVAVVVWELEIETVKRESKRITDELKLAKSVQDLIAIEPHWPEETWTG